MQQQDSYFVVAHLHYVLVGGSLFGLFAGIYYWWPKMTGRLLSERVGRWNFWLMFLGFNVTFFPMHFLGLMGMPRRIYTYAGGLGWDLWNLVATIGAFILAVGILVFIGNAAASLLAGMPAPADPWDGRTLEWSIPSPPPEYNFAQTPTVHFRDELWALKTGRVPREMPPPAPREIHLPPPSYYPILVAAGILVAATGALTHVALVVAGALVIVFGVYRWAFEYRS
jgi:cytochrome c oxidase subunit 1